MKHKSLRRISITTTLEAEDAVAEWLSATVGLPASAYHDNESGASTVTVYLQRKLLLPRKLRAVISAGLRRIQACGLKIGSGKIALAKLRRENWAESWKRHFKPFEIEFENREDEPCEPLPTQEQSGTRVTRPSQRTGNSLLIRPSWSKRKARKGQAVVVLDPGLSFGTGQHPTTAFCLGEIVAAVCDRRTHRSQSAAAAKSFLDLGTGSGILAIAAAKLGYSPVLAIDFDPEAVRVARANARANRIDRKLNVVRGDVSKLPIRPGQQRQRYDLVCANLISNLLIGERRRIVAQLNRPGTLVLAGILESEFGKVQKAYKVLGLRMISRRDEKEWRSGSFRFGD